MIGTESRAVAARGWGWGRIEAGCSQEEGPKKGFVIGSRTRGVQEILEKCM